MTTENDTNSDVGISIDWEVARTLTSGDDVRISFESTVGLNYRLERTDSLSGTIVWTTVEGAEELHGTGAILQATDVSAANEAQRFYRVVVP